MQIHFVTGKLAEQGLRNILESLAQEVGFEYTIQVMPITVAALMTPAWLASRLKIPPETNKLILPGYCDGDLEPLKEVTQLPIEVGPKDLRQLPGFFGQKQLKADFGEWDIEIIAEINHAPRLDIKSILAMAEDLRRSGANLIDVGCEPNGFWSDVGHCVAALKEEGHRVSIDSLNPDEIEMAVAAGAELVLSVNYSNRQHATDWGCEVVAIPDDIHDLNSLQDTIDYLSQRNVPLRIDPILEPIGFGFAASLQRYLDARERWPDAEMMMGIGNLTELTDVDSAGINFLLLAFCQELGIRSVLTTQVINWARSAVVECDIARRLVHYSQKHHVPPKKLSTQLVMLRDAKIVEHGIDQLQVMAAAIRDHNYRIFAESGTIHLLGGGRYWSAEDPFDLFDQLADSGAKNLTPSHAFYLGFEMCKALTALQLGKQYTQDEALDWGFLTQPEHDRHRLKRRKPTKD